MLPLLLAVVFATQQQAIYQRMTGREACEARYGGRGKNQRHFHDDDGDPDEDEEPGLPRIPPVVRCLEKLDRDWPVP